MFVVPLICGIVPLRFVAGALSGGRSGVMQAASKYHSSASGRKAAGSNSPGKGIDGVPAADFIP